MHQSVEGACTLSLAMLDRTSCKLHVGMVGRNGFVVMRPFSRADGNGDVVPVSSWRYQVLLTDGGQQQQQHESCLCSSSLRGHPEFGDPKQITATHVTDVKQGELIPGCRGHARFIDAVLCWLSTQLSFASSECYGMFFQLTFLVALYLCIEEWREFRRHRDCWAACIHYGRVFH